MDRTIIAPWKAEEKELSEKLFKKLQGLALLAPPTEDFRKCLADDMFLKPNPQAFFQCMHFLFRLLDPVEFKKRFFWPITDKRSEANFRTSTVDYLKHLNEKHQLQWTNIKSYLVVMPGGMKFITFMLDLVGFVILELIRQREKVLTEQEPKIIEQVSDVNLKRMRRQNEFFKEFASAYISEVDVQIVKLQEKMQLLCEKMESISQLCCLDSTLLKKNAFHAEFEATNERLFEQQFIVRSTNVKQLERPLCELKNVVDKFQSKESDSKYNQDKVRHVLRQISEMFSVQFKNGEDSFVNPCNVDSSGGIKMSRLIAAFNSIQETMETALKVTNQKTCAGEFVEQELATLLTEYQEIEVQVTDFQKMLNTSAAKKRSKEQSTSDQKNFQLLPPQTPMHGIGGGGVDVGGKSDGHCVNRFLSKYVCTPPIKLEMPESISRIVNTRLPLLDDFQSSRSLESFHNFPAMSAHSVRKPSRLAESSFLDLNNTTMNKSRIIDPVQLLRTINKPKTSTKLKSTPQQQLSTFGSKWKERQNIFGNDLESTTTINCTIIDEDGPITPFNANDCTRVTRSQLATHDNSFGAGTTSGTTPLYVKRLSAVKKVQDASFHLHNLSTSPSGRLDALVNIGCGVSSVSAGVNVNSAFVPPKLQLNDRLLSDNASEETLLLENCIDSASDVVKAVKLIKQIENDENNCNVANAPSPVFPPPLIMDENIDELFNMSDSVLRDIIM